MKLGILAHWIYLAKQKRRIEETDVVTCFNLEYNSGMHASLK